jgi:hypothetical protein
MNPVLSAVFVALALSASAEAFPRRLQGPRGPFVRGPPANNPGGPWLPQMQPGFQSPEFGRPQEAFPVAQPGAIPQEAFPVDGSEEEAMTPPSNLPQTGDQPQQPSAEDQANTQAPATIMVLLPESMAGSAVGTTKNETQSNEKEKSMEEEKPVKKEEKKSAGTQNVHSWTTTAIGLMGASALLVSTM